MHSTPQIEKASTVGDPGPATTAKAPDFRLKKLEERPGGFGPFGLCAGGDVFNNGDEPGPFGLCADSGTVFNDRDEPGPFGLCAGTVFNDADEES